MSWIFGILNKNFTSKLDFNIPSIVKSNCIKSFHIKNCDIYIGGNQNNLYYNVTEENKTGWISSGIGILKYNNGIKLLDKSGWNKIILNNDDIANEIDGHFVILNWDLGKICIYTDNLGLRDIYIKETNNKIIFSTRIDLIAEIEKLEINFKEFGSRWLLYNQLSDKSIFTDIKRISGGKKVKIYFSQSPPEYIDHFWLPDLTEKVINEKEFSDILGNVINIENQDDYKLSLSLSGGMDSRVILSFLMNKEKSLWETHTFGDPTHPDSLIADKISKDYGIEHFQLYTPLPDIASCINEMNEYIKFTLLNNPASAILQLKYYPFIRKNKIIIDGGFGEIWRREFLNRLLWKGKQALVNQNFNVVLTHLRINRADIFHKEKNDLMLIGCKEQLEGLYSRIPSVDNIGVETWLDIFAIKTRLVNFYSHEQTRLDNLGTAYMPFAQLSLLKNLFLIPVNLRKNGQLFIKVIKNYSPALTKYFRVKSNIAHPFNFNSIQSRIWSLIRSKLGYNVYIDNSRHEFLNHMKEYIFDTIYSAEVRNNNLYDYKKIKKITEEYFKGRKDLAGPLDWWLSFEIFRKTILDK